MSRGLRGHVFAENAHEDPGTTYAGALRTQPVGFGPNPVAESESPGAIFTPCPSEIDMLPEAVGTSMRAIGLLHAELRQTSRKLAPGVIPLHVTFRFVTSSDCVLSESREIVVQVPAAAVGGPSTRFAGALGEASNLAAPSTLARLPVTASVMKLFVPDTANAPSGSNTAATVTQMMVVS